MVALHAKDTPSESPLWPQARPGHPGAPGPVHPTRRSGGGGPCSRMRLPYCSPLGMSWGSTPQSSSQSTPLPGRRRRTQVRLASPAERWGGFGTCVQSKAPGPRSSPKLTSSNSPPTRTPEQPAGALLRLPRTTATHTRVHRYPALRPPNQVRMPGHRLGSENPDMDQTTALHTWSGPALRRTNLRASASPKPRTRQDVTMAVPGDLTITGMGAPAPAAPLWTEHRAHPLTRTWTTINNPHSAA